MLEMKLKIYGQVQRVGFRYSVFSFVKNELNVRGLIRNMPDGTVELIAQGDIEELKKLRHYTSSGVQKATVRDIQEEIKPIEQFNYPDFDITE